MGIAEPIAIKTIVTANSFAISLRLWPDSLKPSMEPPQLLTAATPGFNSAPGRMKPALLRLKREIGSSRLACGYGHFLGLRLIGFVPGRHRVISRGDIIDGVIAAGVRGRVGAFYHHMPPVHPGMYVALHRDHFRIFPTFFNWGGARRLRLIPRNVAGHGIRQRVNIMG